MSVAVRGKVLYLAHSAPSSGHNGRRKTLKRVLKYFHWPGVCNDVKEYVRSCDACQRANKGGKVDKAPMVSPPITEMPFSRVSADVFGP